MMAFHEAVRLVALLNLAYFAVEALVAFTIGSVSLFAGSAAFLGSSCRSLLMAVALDQSCKAPSRMSALMLLAFALPALATVWTAWQQISTPTAPAYMPFAVTALGALLVNLNCALILHRYRAHDGSWTRAAFLFARHEILAGIAILSAAMLTALVRSVWPDVIVGVVVLTINLGAARQMLREFAPGRPAAAMSSRDHECG